MGSEKGEISSDYTCAFFISQAHVSYSTFLLTHQADRLAGTMIRYLPGRHHWILVHINETDSLFVYILLGTDTLTKLSGYRQINWRD